jgi:hypothetical protein
VVRQHWDNELSAKQNLERLGLRLQPNAPPEAEPKASPVEFFGEVKT